MFRNFQRTRTPAVFIAIGATWCINTQPPEPAPPSLDVAAVQANRSGKRVMFSADAPGEGSLPATPLEPATGEVRTLVLTTSKGLPVTDQAATAWRVNSSLEET
jgi:hypothetical protein